MPALEQEIPEEEGISRLLQPLSGRVLVVDDELPNRLYMRKLLEARECEVFDAGSAMAALDIAMKKQPDLILVDIIMPEMDGFELCGRLRDESRTRHIPIIMVTAKSKIEDIETGFEQGAMDYIRKPFNPRELMLRVGNALALKKSNDALSIWNKRVARDLELAGAIQRSLFSDKPHFSRRFEVRIAYRTCMDVGGENGQGPDSLNLAACHCCALLPETACEEFNRLLDRGVVIGMPTEPTLGYFSRA